MYEEKKDDQKAAFTVCEGYVCDILMRHISSKAWGAGKKKATSRVEDGICVLLID